MTVRTSAIVTAVLVLGAAALPARAAPAASCDREAAALVKDEADLPNIKFVTPADRPPYCITLETIMAFAARLKAHVAHCSNSNYASAASNWEKTRTDYAKLFVQTRCKRTLLN